MIGFFQLHTNTLTNFHGVSCDFASQKRQTMDYFPGEKWKTKSRFTPQQPVIYQTESFDWEKCARANQKPPSGKWTVWLILAGRGFGKTRTGSETVRMFVDQKRYKRIALVGQTIEETRGVMVDGVSGILSVYPPDDKNFPVYERSKQRICWPNGAIAQIFGADHYDHLRGPQFDFVWMDEFAKFRYPQKIYEQVMLGLRLGDEPRCLITTTPRPLPIFKTMMRDEMTVVTRGTTFDNAKNLSDSFMKYVTKQFSHTQLGQQELYANLLFQEQNALWSRKMIRYQKPQKDLARIVLAVDPAVTCHTNSDETGIIVMGKDLDGSAFVLDDLSGKFRPNQWGALIAKKFHDYHADRVVAEVNQGGDLVEEMIRAFDRLIPYTSVRATRGKLTRAEPIAALYEQGLVFHVQPFPQLETQMCEYVPEQSPKSPDRMDALVWGITELFQSELGQTVKVWC